MLKHIARQKNAFLTLKYRTEIKNKNAFFPQKYENINCNICFYYY